MSGLRIIVLNCFSRNALAVLNAVDPSYELIGGTINTISPARLDSLFKSGRLSAVFRHRDPGADPEGFKSDIISKIKNHSADAVIATGTTITNYLSKFKSDIVRETGARVLVEDYDKLDKMTDKWKIYEICRTVGVPMPNTVRIEDQKQLHDIVNDKIIDYPFVIKPCSSYASKGLAFFEKPSDVERYRERWRDNKSVSGPFVVQERITGKLHDVTSCSKNGKVISMLTQERLVAYYDFGGGGIINRTTYEPEIMGYAEKIIEHMNWNGIAEFDFIRDSDGRYYLLECNPKIWGTTQLTVEAGLNMPQQLVDLMVLDKDIPAKKEYESGLVYKWLFPECVAHVVHQPRTVTAMLRRIKRIVMRYDSTRTINNLRWGDLRHLAGIVLNKSFV